MRTESPPAELFCQLPAPGSEDYTRQLEGTSSAFGSAVARMADDAVGGTTHGPSSRVEFANGDVYEVIWSDTPSAPLVWNLIYAKVVIVIVLDQVILHFTSV